jgi:hypothetical protein
VTLRLAFYIELEQGSADVRRLAERWAAAERKVATFTVAEPVHVLGPRWEVDVDLAFLAEPVDEMTIWATA